MRIIMMMMVMRRRRCTRYRWDNSCSHQLDLLSHDFDFRPIYLDLDHDDHDEVYDDTDGDATSWTCSNIS